MFEKEAEEYVMREDVITENDRVPFDNGYGFQTVSFEDEVKKGFKDGAEFGYNKAKEEIEKLKELVLDCLFYCDHIDPYYNECLTEDNIFERAEKLGVKYE